MPSGGASTPSLTDFEFCASDVRFHRVLVNATQNSILQLALISVVEALQPVGHMVVFRFRERGLIVSQHERIYIAVKERNPDAGVAAWSEQIAYLSDKYADAQEWRRQQDQSAAD